MERNGAAIGNPALEAQGLPTFHAVYEQAHGKPLSGAKWEALLLLNHLGTQLQRIIVFPKGTPMEAAHDMRAAFQAVIRDPDCIADYQRITGERPDISPAEDVEPVLARLRALDPAVKQIVREAIAEK